MLGLFFPGYGGSDTEVLDRIYTRISSPKLPLWTDVVLPEYSSKSLCAICAFIRGVFFFWGVPFVKEV